MASLATVRDALLIPRYTNIIDDAEFACSWDAGSRQTFPYYKFERFDIDAWDESECWTELRFGRQDLDLLREYLQIPDEIVCCQRSVCEGMEGMCILFKRLGARSIRPKILVWISPKFSDVEWNGIFHQAGTDLVQFQLEHISHQELLEKMLKDHDESGCLKCRIKLLHVQKVNTHSEFNSSLIFMRETYELFSRESMQTGRTDPQEIRSGQSTIFSGNQILTFSLSIKNRLELWQNILHPV